MTDTLEIPAWVNGADEPEPESEFFYFPYADQREELFEFCATTADYIVEEEVAAVAFIDRSARPMAAGLHEYWKRTFGDTEQAPAMFFVNPEGFMDGAASRLRFETEHPELAKHNEDTVLLVDTCIHFGSTMRAVAGGFEDSGFEDVRTAVMNNKPKFTKTKPDLVVQRKRPAGKCYPFSQENLVAKGSSLHSYAERDPDALQETIEIRREIKQIIAECAELRSAQATSYTGPRHENLVRKQRIGSALGLVAGLAAMEFIGIKSDTETTEAILDLLMGGTIGVMVGRMGGLLASLKELA